MTFIEILIKFLLSPNIELNIHYYALVRNVQTEIISF